MSGQWTLEIVGGSGPSMPLPEHGALVVGSDAKRASWVRTEAEVEGVHCAFARAKDGRWAIKDLGSAGGTYVNGAKVSTAAISDGDTVRVGTLELVVRVVAPPASEPAMKATPRVRGFQLEKQVRKVALKILASKYAANPQFVAQFQREARAAAALNHPNVVTVYDVGEDAGVHYLSMEYMERGTLEDRVGNGRSLSPDETLSILLDATAGLVYAEQRGIVHRDIKPANLMQNHVGQTKIADLGLATHAQDEEPPTGEKKVFGTPHFMPPEQIRGERVDVRSDLYSLGATAFRLLSGRTPFEGKDTRDIVRQVLAVEPRSIREVAPQVDAGLATIVDRLLKKDPAQRYQSAQELLRALETLADGPAVPAAGAAPTKKSSSGALIAVLMLATTGGAAWYFKDDLLAK